MSSGGAACATTPRERIGRGVFAVVMAVVAVGSLSALWIAIPAGVFAVFLAIGAITGWCPTSLFQRASAQPEPNSLGYAEARQTFDA